MKSLLLNTCDLFSRIFEVFNEMEMEININDKIFTKVYLKIRVKRLERIDLLITASVNIYRKGE